MQGLVDKSLCQVGVGLIVGTSLAFLSSVILISAITAGIGAASSSVLAGLLYLLMGTNAMRGAGGAYSWFVGDGGCQK